MIKFLSLIFGVAVFIELMMIIVALVKEYFINKEDKTPSEI